MEQPEVPLESVQEHVEHAAHHSGNAFVSLVAVSTAILAAFAAVTSLLAGAHANEAMIEQIQSSDQWAFFQAKSIKAAILQTKLAVLKAQGQPENPTDLEKLKTYVEEQKDIEQKAREKHHRAEVHLHRHESLASAVTLLQVAIAIGAISALTKKRPFWFASLLSGLGGVAFLLRDLFAH
ncbi:MAG: hypothetical protein RLZZ244_2799 [Verrucomicrobiota bacterium]|jgi:VIT1/CCC1 family predicted Fe2+/Mn2+ transporter